MYTDIFTYDFKGCKSFDMIKKNVKTHFLSKCNCGNKWKTNNFVLITIMNIIVPQNKEWLPYDEGGKIRIKYPK